MSKAVKLARAVGVGGVLEDGEIQAAQVTGLATVAFTNSYNDLINKPSIPSITGLASETYVNNAIDGLVNGAPGTLNTLKEIADQLAVDESAVAAITTTLASKANTSSLATVATSGSYADLTSKPTLFSGSYADLTNKPALFSGSYADLTDKPTLFSGSYADLTGKPTLSTVATSGSYNDLTNKPTLFDGTYASLTGKPTTLSGYGITDGFTLPSQTGNAGKSLTTNGTSVSWGTAVSTAKLYFFKG